MTFSPYKCLGTCFLVVPKQSRSVVFYRTVVNPGVMNVEAMSLDFRDTPYQFTGGLKAQKVARLEKL